MTVGLIQENFYCTNCGNTSEGGRECCGANMVERTEVEGYGISDFEPAGGSGSDLVDEWN